MRILNKPSPSCPADPRYLVSEQLVDGGVRSQLVLRRVEERDYGDYNCTVENEYGEAALTIRLSQERKSAKGSTKNSCD